LWHVWGDEKYDRVFVGKREGKKLLWSKFYFHVTVHHESWRWINNQPDAEKMYLLVSQHVSGIIMPIIRRTVQSR
jgi:hypothetical protein